MWQEDRRQRLRSMLATFGTVSVDHATRELDVSRETIRRDLLDMELAGELRRVRGGAVGLEAAREAPYAVRTMANLREKRRIAACAARLIRPGQMLFLDAGSTTTILAERLALLSGITVVTNSIDVASRIALPDSLRKRGNQVVLLGGSFAPQPPATFGAATLREIGLYHADIALLSPFGLDAEAGATSYDRDEAEIARAMFHNARQRVLLADHTKLGRVSRCVYCFLAEADEVIIDAKAEPLSVLEPIRNVATSVTLA
ncbi:DeoR/GlpR family DNA-binding transcription regulator [Pararhodobacter sp. SW119]|uniref:DeoR/GlpR family DNA-binding transcription regulator n=1 Tax=Pararhodobacter sp. SW119 TaxID=2780075 RepID=UPI001ADF55CE|nr:DeoR/GlpR family DNA-binding transcription regulator [Pararhodobacter sp. SW119]